MLIRKVAVYYHQEPISQNIRQFECLFLFLFIQWSSQTLAKVHLVKAVVFPVVMYGCESWTVKKAELRRIDGFELCYWTALESPLDCKEIQPVRPKGDQCQAFIGRTDAEAETPVLWPPHAKS